MPGFTPSGDVNVVEQYVDQDGDREIQGYVAWMDVEECVDGEVAVRLTQAGNVENVFGRMGCTIPVTRSRRSRRHRTGGARPEREVVVTRPWFAVCLLLGACAIPTPPHPPPPGERDDTIREIAVSAAHYI